MRAKRSGGFSGMDPARQREISAKGGRAAHAKGTAHSWSEAEAREMGRRGGRAIAQDREHMVTIGKEGGRVRREALLAQARAEATHRSPGGAGRSPLLGEQRMT